MATRAAREDDFRRFVEAHWLGLVRSAYLLVGDHGAAEDLVQHILETDDPLQVFNRYRDRSMT